MLANKYKITKLITMENRPKVSKLIGSVKNSKSGLIRLLSSPSTTATTTAFKKELTCTPGTIYAEISTERPFTIRDINMFILYPF
jgi:hypothetical protein